MTYPNSELWGIETLNITQAEFRKYLGWPYARLNEIVNKHRGVTADSALAFGEALGTGVIFWLNLQRDWELWHSERKHKEIPQLPQASAISDGF